jgi:hypothetical protein
VQDVEARFVGVWLRSHAAKEAKSMTDRNCRGMRCFVHPLFLLSVFCFLFSRTDYLLV